MSDNSEFIDYEPLTPPRKNPVGAEPVEDRWVRRKNNESGPADFEQHNNPPQAFAQEESSHLRRNEKSSAIETRKKLRTGGHGASFVGLFLFTLVLCFRPYEFSSALSWMSVSAFWIAAVTLVIFVLTQLGLEGNLSARPREVNLALVLLVTALLSIPGSYNLKESWETFVDFLKVLLIFIVLANVVRSQLRLKALLWIAMAVSIVLSVSAINDYRTGNFRVAGGRVAGVIGGMFANPNDMALQLVTIIPIVVAFFFGGGLLKKVLYGACAILMVTGCVVTFSRGGLLGLIGMSAVLTWKMGRKHKLAALIIVVVLCLALIVFAPGEFANRLGSIGDASATQRRDVLLRSILVALRHPLFGIGIGNFHIVSIQELVSHNAYTQVAAEMGLLAFAAYTMLILSPIKRLREIERETFEIRHSSRFYYLAIGLQASLTGYMICSFFASVAYQWYVYYLVGYAISLHRLYKAGMSGTNDASEKVGPVKPDRGEVALFSNPADVPSRVVGPA